MYLHTYIWVSTHKYRKQRQRRQNSHITWEKRHILFHTQMLAFLFLASNAKHILQFISDMLYNLKHIMEMFWDVYTWQNQVKLPASSKTYKEVCSEKQAEPFVLFCSRQHGSTLRCTTPKTSCLLQLGGHWSHLPWVSFPPLSPNLMAIIMVVGLLPSSTRLGKTEGYRLCSGACS